MKYILGFFVLIIASYTAPYFLAHYSPSQETVKSQEIVTNKQKCPCQKCPCQEIVKGKQK